MKKLISIILIICIILGIAITSKASEDLETEKTSSIEVTIEGPTSIEEGTETISLTIKLGAFTGIEENKIIGYETLLSYNSTAIEDVTVEGLNGWIATYQKDTKRLIGEINSAKANTEIVKITYKLKEDLTTEENLEMSFINFNITDDNLLDQTINLSKKITIKEKVQDVEQEENQISNNTAEEEQTETSNNSTKKDNTIKKAASLPKTGLGNRIITIIFVIFIIGILCIIRSKSIKLK